MDKSPLARLTVKLRRKIYELVLCQPDELLVYPRDGELYSLPAAPRKNFLAITAVCKAISVASTAIVRPSEGDKGFQDADSVDLHSSTATTCSWSQLWPSMTIILLNHSKTFGSPLSKHGSIELGRPMLRVYANYNSPLESGTYRRLLSKAVLWL